MKKCKHAGKFKEYCNEYLDALHQDSVIDASELLSNSHFMTASLLRTSQFGKCLKHEKKNVCVLEIKEIYLLILHVCNMHILYLPTN